MSRDKIIKVSVVVLSLLMVLLLLGSGIQEKRERELREERREAYKQTDRQIRQLRDQIAQAEKEIRQMKFTGYVCLAFRRDNPALTDTILPLLEQYGWKGTLILSPDDSDGGNGLPEEEIRRLTQEGWGIAVGAGAEDILETGDKLEQAQRTFLEKGFGEIQGYFFNKGDYQYREPIYQKLEEIGCRFGCPIGSREEVIPIDNLTDASVMECQNLSLDKSPQEVGELLLQIRDQGAVIVFTDYTSAGTWDGWEMETPDYEGIFREIHEKVASGELLLGTLDDYREYRDGWLAEREEKEQQYQLYYQEQEEKIQELKEKATAG